MSAAASQQEAGHQRGDRGDGEDVEDARPADQHRCGDQGSCKQPRRDRRQQRASGQQAVREQGADWLVGIAGEDRCQHNGNGVADDEREATHPCSFGDHEHDPVHRPSAYNPQTRKLQLLLLPDPDCRQQNEQQETDQDATAYQEQPGGGSGRLGSSVVEGRKRSRELELTLSSGERRLGSLQARLDIAELPAVHARDLQRRAVVGSVDAAQPTQAIQSFDVAGDENRRLAVEGGRVAERHGGGETGGADDSDSHACCRHDCGRPASAREEHRAIRGPA
ncbi:MAG: hypothetical protein ACXVTC_24140 [Solirubrobacteraceae bacterium]